MLSCKEIFDRIKQSVLCRLFTNSLAGVLIGNLLGSGVNIAGIISQDFKARWLSRITSPIGWILGNFFNLCELCGLSKGVRKYYGYMEKLSLEGSKKFREEFSPTKRQVLGITLNVVSLGCLVTYIVLIEDSLFCEERATREQLAKELCGSLGIVTFLSSYFSCTVPLQRRLKETKRQYEENRRLEGLNRLRDSFSDLKSSERRDLAGNPISSYVIMGRRLQRFFIQRNLAAESVPAVQLENLFQQHIGKLRRGYTRQKVASNGKCGYKVFGITREQVHQSIYQHLQAVRNLLVPAVQEALLVKNFFQYLQSRSLIEPEVPHHAIREKLQDYASDLEIIRAYIDYDVECRAIDMGWAHPAVLQALAHIQGMYLHIWQLDEEERLVPHAEPQYAQYSPPGATEQLDLLFFNNNHFDRVGFEGYDNPAAIVPPIFPFKLQEDTEKMLAFLMTMNKESFVLLMKRFYLQPPKEDREVSEIEGVIALDQGHGLNIQGEVAVQGESGHAPSGQSPLPQTMQRV